MKQRQQTMPEITATELKQRLDNGDDIQIIDVREANEVAIGKLPGSIHIPLGQIVNRMSEIDPARETVVHCKMGGRSARAIEALKRSGFERKLEKPEGWHPRLVQRCRSQRAEVLTACDYGAEFAEHKCGSSISKALNRRNRLGSRGRGCLTRAYLRIRLIQSTKFSSS